MKKLKKLLKNKKPVVIFIYGPVAVGKLTVAKILSKRLKYKLAHNHHTNDFVDKVFTRRTFARDDIVERLRSDLLKSAVKAKINLVTTHCYAHNFISTTGLSDPKYLKTLEKKLTKLGANFYAVHLRASPKELLRRLSLDSRKEFKKLRDKKRMHELLSICDWNTSPKLKNNLVIDNTNISAKKVSNIIIKHFKLK